MKKQDKNLEKMATVGRMTRGLVHDINNSLASIMGYADFLTADLPPESEQFLFAENIKKSGLQLQNLIDQIRAVSAEKNAKKDVPLNLVDEIRILSERIAAHLEKKQHLHFSSDISSAILTLPRYQFKTLIDNLLKNAIDSLCHKDGHITVHISQMNNDMRQDLLSAYHSVLDIHPFQNQNKDTPFITITISDTGCGMDEDTLNQSPIAHFTTHSHDEFHGMGLTVAKEIIDYLEGGLTIASTVGKGTCLIITLPVENIETEKTDIPDITEKQILVIEDRETVLHTIETMLQRQHHKVTATTDAFAALDFIREQPDKYDVLITDYTMQDMNGADLIEEVRQDFQNIPIILMSGDQEYLSNVAKKKHKNILVLQKPINSQDLKRAIFLACTTNKLHKEKIAK